MVTSLKVFYMTDVPFCSFLNMGRCLSKGNTKAAKRDISYDKSKYSLKTDFTVCAVRLKLVITFRRTSSVMKKLGFFNIQYNIGMDVPSQYST